MVIFVLLRLLFITTPYLEFNGEFFYSNYYKPNCNDQKLGIIWILNKSTIKSTYKHPP